MKKTTLLLASIITMMIAVAQQPDSLNTFSTGAGKQPRMPGKTTNFLSRGYISPATLMIIYGFASLKIEGLKEINREVKEEIMENNEGFKTQIDDYLQYTPSSMFFLLEAGGIKGKHTLKDKTIIYGMSMVIMTSVVASLKAITYQLRPNGLKYNSFPSGHTANAFMGASLLNQEYAARSPVYGYAGYGVAASTGVLRMYNNKHWFADVLAGAGIGILSAKAGYWIFSKIEKKRNLKYRKKLHTAF